jgi:hypothetical protein
MSSDALSATQFQFERQLLGSGNTNGVDDRVRGIQRRTSNIYMPSFYSDYTRGSQVRGFPSPAASQKPTAAAPQQEGEGESEEEE